MYTRADIQEPKAVATWAQEKVNQLQKRLEQFPKVEMPLRHLFTPGMYVREITMPAGTAVVSHVHKTEHPFVISKGSVTVWTERYGVMMPSNLSAPYTGITTPGTRRVLYVHEETIWTTFHAGPWSADMPMEQLESCLVDKVDLSHLEKFSADLVGSGKVGEVSL